MTFLPLGFRLFLFQLQINKIAEPIAVSTSGRVYEDFARLLFLHAHREASILAGELPEESEQFRFFRASRLANLKDSVGLID